MDEVPSGYFVTVGATGEHGFLQTEKVLRSELEIAAVQLLFDRVVQRDELVLPLHRAEAPDACKD